MAAVISEAPALYNPDGPLMSDETVDRFIHHALQATTPIGVDTETSGIDGIKDGRDYCTGISIDYDLTGAGSFSAYFPFRHRARPEQNLSIATVLPKLKTVLKEKPHTFHNRKFDLHSLATLGIQPTDLHPESDCSLVMAQLWNEELPSKQLEWLSARFLNDHKVDKVTAFGKAFGWEQIPPYLMNDYAKHDASLARRLREFLWAKLEATGLAELWPIERDFGTTLFYMEQMGLKVDTEFCARKAEQGDSRMDAIKQELGFDPGSSNDLTDYFFDELKLPVLAVGKPTKRFPDGRPSMKKAVMDEYESILSVRNDASAKLVLEYRGWQKAVTSLYLPMLNLLSPDGRIRTNFNQHVARTGRLSSSGPNFQQIPRSTDKDWNGDAKKAFIEDDGYELWGWDFSQLEFRLAACYGSEVSLLEEFNKPDSDVFTAMAEQSGIDRYTIKNGFTYPTLYGAGLPKIASGIKMTVAEAEPLFEKFLSTIPGIRAASKTASNRAKQRGYVKYWTGRRRNFPYEEGHHKAFNAILQGGSAELVKRSQLRCREIENDDCRMVSQIHDEILFRIRKGQKDKYEPEIIERMTNWPQFPVHFAVEGKQWPGTISDV